LAIGAALLFPFWTVVWLWIVAKRGKISSRLFGMDQSASVAEQRTAMTFGIKVYAIFLAVQAAIMLIIETRSIIAQMSLAGTASRYLFYDYALPNLLAILAQIAVCIYLLKRPGRFVSFAFRGRSLR